MDEIKYIRKERKTPDTFQDIASWETKRRTFLKGLVVAGALSQISILSSCKANLERGDDILSAEQATILKSVLEILWPDDGNGPGSEDIKAFEYVVWVLHDELNRYEDDNEFIIDGLIWTNETAEEIYFDKYVNLDQDEKEALIGLVVETSWGKSWGSAMLTLIFEALLMDPIYGCKPNEVGWTW